MNRTEAITVEVPIVRAYWHERIRFRIARWLRLLAAEIAP